MAYGRIAGVQKGTTSQTMTNKTIVQTMDNILCFCGNFNSVTLNASQAIFKVPTGMEPANSTIRFAAVYSESGTYKVGAFSLLTNGYVYTLQALNNANVYFNGICLNLNDDYYNDTIGNNDPSNMSRPVIVS